MLQKLVNKGFPEHIVADGIIYTWLYLSGSKSDRSAKMKAFNQRFKLSGLSEYSKELVDIVRFDSDESLIWASKTLMEFLPSDMQDQYLNEYVKFCCVKNALWISEFHILEFISVLFGKSRASLEQKLQQYGGHQISDLSSDLQNRIEKDFQAGFRKEKVIAGIKRARRVLKLGEQEFISLHEKSTVSKSKKKQESPKPPPSSSYKTSNSVRKENWWENLTKKHAIWAAVTIIAIPVLWNVISSRSSQFQRELRQETHQLLVEFDKKQLSVQERLLSNDIAAYREFRDRFDKEAAYVDDYATFMGVRTEYSYPSKEYISCLESDVKAQLQSEENRAKYDSTYHEYKERFGNSLDSFLANLEDSGYSMNQRSVTECEQFFGQREYFVFDEGYWEDIEKVLMTNSREQAQATAQNLNREREFENDVRSFGNQLRAEYRTEFTNQIERNRSSILQEDEIEVTVETDNIGAWTTTTTRLDYNKNELNRIFERAETAQWETNSLWTGAMPYANCFGSRNSCSGWDCSEIEVTAGSSDVIVTIKNSSDRVVRHAYIRSRQNFSFDLANGTYFVYFYSGEGWNPNKAQESSSCSSLSGGFVKNESFSKDHEANRLNNHHLTYELREMMSGNFRPGSSDAAEAF